MPSNGPSLRVAEKLGFRREGFAQRYLHIAGKWEDHILFAKLSDDASSAIAIEEFTI
jgi:ribosomal-protein-alanine N-acetyltransferase